MKICYSSTFLYAALTLCCPLRVEGGRIVGPHLGVPAAARPGPHNPGVAQQDRRAPVQGHVGAVHGAEQHQQPRLLTRLQTQHRIRTCTVYTMEDDIN